MPTAMIIEIPQSRKPATVEPSTKKLAPTPTILINQHRMKTTHVLTTSSLNTLKTEDAEINRVVSGSTNIAHLEVFVSEAVQNSRTIIPSHDAG